jgi:hypothetical protein
MNAEAATLPRRPPCPARSNPFRAERIEALRFQYAAGDWDNLLERLRTLRWQAAIVGREGSGKTTLLCELAARLEDAGHSVRLLLADGRQRLAASEFAGLLAAARETPGLLLLDGADRLTRWQWWRLVRASRAAAGLLVTLHQPGRLPTLHRCETTPQLLAELVGELLRGAEARRFATDEDLEALFVACRGDLRAALRVLYDRWAVESTAAPA